MFKSALTAACLAAVTAIAVSRPAWAIELADVAHLPREKVIRVLVIHGGHPFDHTEFMQMFEGQPDIVWMEAKQPEAMTWFAPDKADQYDVMVWYDMWKDAPGEQDAKNLLALLDSGKPLLVLHHAIATYYPWPEAEKIIGGKYLLEPRGDAPGSTFKHGRQIAVKIADPNHPITRFMSDFEIEDETYDKVPILPDVKPLLTTDTPGSMSPPAWTHTYGKSPVVYIQLGHGPTAFRNPSYRRFVLQSIRWLDGALPDASEEGFVPLFDGKSFDGWTIMGKPEGFWIKDGVIRSESNKGGEWMRTNKPYDNFILRVQWRAGMGGNSGIFVRSAIGRFPWLTGSEIQISNEFRDALHCTGALYGLAPVNPRPDERADVWHETEVQCMGPHMKVFCDNIPVVDVDARWVPNLAGRPWSGFIGLQDSHNRESYVEFRKALVKELPMTIKGAAAWRLATQAYTFHKYTLFEAIDKAHELGLTLIEMFPGQALSPEEPDVRFDHNASKELRAKVRAKLEQAGVSVVNYGVVGLSHDEADARKVFAFARDMDIQTIVSEPEDSKACFDLIEKLADESGVNVAIHDHPKPSHYWDPRIVLRAVEGRSKRLGACADTGHWMRSGIRPIDAIRLLKGRIISLHLKDLNEFGNPGAHDVPWGTGAANMKEILTELDRQGFSGVFSIEYEYNWTSSMPEIAKCIEYFKAMTTELAKK